MLARKEGYFSYFSMLARQVGYFRMLRQEVLQINQTPPFPPRTHSLNPGISYLHTQHTECLRAAGLKQ